MVLHPILSVCSGIGGLDLGVRRALGGAARVICYVERDAAACEVLAARIAEGFLDDAPIWTDLRTFDGRPWRGKVAGIVGGYPCQPFSVAGKRLGTEDPRHLWPSIERLIGEVRPVWCFFENVGGHLRLGYWDVVRPSLERLGYRVAEGLFTAAEVGATHWRERLFILAHAACSDWRGGEFNAEEGSWEAWGDGPAGGGGGLDSRDAEWACKEEAGKHSVLVNSSCQRCAWGEQSESHRDAFAAALESASEPGYSWPPGPMAFEEWADIIRRRPDLAPAVESEVCRVVDGFSDRMDISRRDRLRLLGNAVVPAQAERAFRVLLEKLFQQVRYE